MQLVIRAHKLHTDSPPQAITAQFDERGGSIGRGDDNTLALPDPERHISRTQAEVLFVSGGFSIRNVGSSNPITVNGRPLKPGEDAPLAHGDEIVAGSYCLRASVVADTPRAGARTAPQAAPSAATRLPDDFDPFADMASAAAPADAAMAGFIRDAQAESAAPTGDDGAAQEWATGNHGMGAGMGLNTMFCLDRAPAAHHDPLAAFMSNAPARRSAPAPAAEADHVPELHAAYSPPAVRAETLSPALAPRHPMPAAPPAGDALWLAFCDGAGISSATGLGMSPQTMRTIGQLLRSAVSGTHKLVAARAVTRQELKAGVTLIQASDNNPLKFSPDARAALELLLQPSSRGFMAGPAAMDDAMSDLLAHAVDTLAGMRDAMAKLLERHSPSALEARLPPPDVFDSLLPMKRRARLWALYLQQHQRMREQASGDPGGLLGEAFVQACERRDG